MLMAEGASGGENVKLALQIDVALKILTFTPETLKKPLFFIVKFSCRG
jgi:hypothetical protein